MNAAGIRALEQARGYYREGVVNATKRVKETRQALEEAQEQLLHATAAADELDAALEEAKDVGEARAVTVKAVLDRVRTHVSDQGEDPDHEMFGLAVIAREFGVDS